MAGVEKKTDIRIIKGELRTRFKTLRREMDSQVKAEKDAAILKRLLELPEYKAATLVLTYVSTAIEVDTLELIRRALAEGKRVAVPYCIPGKIDIFFGRSHPGELRRTGAGSGKAAGTPGVFRFGLRPSGTGI